ncbi:MAG: hypothetical protein ACOX37_00430 [Bacillota bacterium]
MKKTLGILLVFAILFLFGSMGCGGDTPQDPVSGQEPNLPQMENPDLGFPVTIVDSLGREITIEKIRNGLFPFLRPLRKFCLPSTPVR